MTYAALRLRPGEDVLEVLVRHVMNRNVSAAFVVSAAGSLARATLRYAGAEMATIIERPLEIVALSGTLSQQGCHLHCAVSDAFGSVAGGHVLRGCIVGATLELVLGETQEFRFSRELDPATGHRELVIKPAD